MLISSPIRTPFGLQEISYAESLASALRWRASRTSISDLSNGITFNVERMLPEILAKTALEVGAEQLAKPTVSLLKHAPPIRRIIARVKRGGGPFAMPAGKIMILYPSLTPGTGTYSVSRNDSAACHEIETCFAKLGYTEKKHWESVEVQEVLAAEERERNLIILCGSNAMWREVQTYAPHVLQNVKYRHHEDRSTRCFVWQNRLYRSTDLVDYAVLAVKPNPYNRNRRLILAFGIRDIGTRGAAYAYANAAAIDLRKQIEKLATRSGDVEVILRVEHDSQRQKIKAVSLATPQEGDAHWDSSRLLPLPPTVEPLNQIYVSLEQTPRPVLISDFEHEVTYRSDYTPEVRWDFTLGYSDTDIVIHGMSVSGSSPLESIDDVDFRARVVGPDGDVIVLPATNELTVKEFLLFPTPPIMRGHSSRRLCVTSRWPRAAGNLETVGKVEKATVQVFRQAAGTVNRVKFTVKFDLAGRFTVQPLFPSPGNGIGDYGSDRPFVHEELDCKPGTSFTVRILRKQ